TKALHPEVLEFVARWALLDNALGRNPDAPTSLVRYKKTGNKTLKQIAEEFKIKLSDLTQYNDWIAEDQPIPAGKEYEVILPISTASPSAEVQVLTMRGGELDFNTYEEDAFTEGTEEVSTSQKTHRVGKGETLFAIARKYGVSVEAIRQWNLMTVNSVIKVGDEIKVEGNAPIVKPTTKTNTNIPKQNLVESTKTTTTKTHTVQAGEGLFKIARMYGVSAGELRNWNKLSSDNLKVGQKIVVKSTTSSSPTGGGGSPAKEEEETPKDSPKENPKENPKNSAGLSYSMRTLEAKTVPTEMLALGMRLRLNADAKQKVQSYVNKLRESAPAYFRQLEIIDGYMPLIERELQKAELPLDFRLLPIQESMLKATAVSKSNAVGYWQFKKESAVEEGIIVNEAIDERMNIVSSTMGAINYLKKSQLMFDNWVNSLLSYNMGRTGAKNQIAKTYKNQNLQGIETMQITGETHWYVLKFLAHIIAFDEEIGVSTPEKQLTDYTQGAKKTLAQIAQENKTTLQAIQPHNKWLKTSAVPVGKPFSVIVLKK
ncbi:MAG: LysM peptidoglycan-binding domain-containing protein, partial [Bacteroidetes bacterium]